MVDIFKASITTEVPNISENEKRLLHYFLNWVENPGNAERTWSEVKTEVIRIAQRGDAKSEQARSAAGNAGPAATGRSQCRCEGRTTKMLGSRMTNYSFMTAVEDAGERLRLHSAGRSRHQLERYNITGAEAMGQARVPAGRDRAVDRRRYAGIGKEREHASVGPAAWAHTHIASNHQPKDAASS
jgi:hypothetical protein